MTLRALRPPQALRLAVGDEDDAFVAALAERCKGDGWRLQRLERSPLDPQELVGAKLNALLLDPAGFGDREWERLRLVCALVPQLAVVVCTARSSVAERVSGLRLGVDAWIAKPCDLEELMARIETVTWQLRSAEGGSDDVSLNVGEIELRPSERQARACGHFFGLTPREFDLLHLFAQRQGQVLEREEIYQRVWGYTMPWGDRSVDVFVLKLRTKLRRHSPDWTYIHTYHRLGYRFEPQVEAAVAVG